MKGSLFTIALTLHLALSLLSGQDVRFSLANFKFTQAEAFGFVEFDVLIESRAGYTLGSGQLYLDYNADAFGGNAWSAGRANITVPDNEDYLLARKDNLAGYVNAYVLPLIVNDNTPSRLSIAFRQNLQAACIAPNVDATPRKLFHVRLDYVPGSTGLPPEVCFASEPPFNGQFFTASGPFETCQGQGANGRDYPGIRLMEDEFDCGEGMAFVPTTSLQTDTSIMVSLYPLPAADFVEVLFYSRSSGDVAIKMWDGQGRLLWAKKRWLTVGENSWRVDLSGVAAGSYYVEFASDGFRATKLVVIVRE